MPIIANKAEKINEEKSPKSHQIAHFLSQGMNSDYGQLEPKNINSPFRENKGQEVQSEIAIITDKNKE